MKEEKDNQVKLITYKKMDVLLRFHKKHYQIGIRGESGIDIWVGTGIYNTLELARTSGKEYACILIDKMLVSRKKPNQL